MCLHEQVLSQAKISDGFIYSISKLRPGISVKSCDFYIVMYIMYLAGWCSEAKTTPLGGRGPGCENFFLLTSVTKPCSHHFPNSSYPPISNIIYPVEVISNFNVDIVSLQLQCFYFNLHCDWLMQVMIRLWGCIGSSEPRTTGTLKCILNDNTKHY